MAQLHDYDFWDVEQNSVRPRVFVDTEPDSRDLWAWAKLRLAKGVHDQDLDSATAEVEELARLCFTTERLGTELAGLGILATARRANERLGTQAQRASLDQQTTRRVHRVLFGALAFTRLETPASYEDDVSQIAVGRCAGLHDGVYLALHLRPALRDSRADEYRHLERLLAASPECRLTWLRRLWALPDEKESFEDEEWLHRITTRWVPGGRQFWGEVLAAIARQDWFKAYDEHPE